MSNSKGATKTESRAESALRRIQAGNEITGDRATLRSYWKAVLNRRKTFSCNSGHSGCALRNYGLCAEKAAAYLPGPDNE